MIEFPKTKEEEEYNYKNWEYRQKYLDSITKRQFQLVYFGRFSYDELDNMALSEFRAVYQYLIDQKEEEAKAAKEAAKRQKEAAAHARARSRRRH